MQARGYYLHKMGDGAPMIIEATYSWNRSAYPVKLVPRNPVKGNAENASFDLSNVGKQVCKTDVKHCQTAHIELIRVTL